jgi:hypothetical protein
MHQYALAYSVCVVSQPSACDALLALALFGSALLNATKKTMRLAQEREQRLGLTWEQRDFQSDEG